MLALFSLLLGCWVLVSRHPPLEDCVVQCLCQDLLNPKCLVVTASVLDLLPQGNDLLPPAVVPFQFAKWRCPWNALPNLVLQSFAVVGEGELLQRHFGAQEPLYGVVQRLGGPLSLVVLLLPLPFSSLGSLPFSSDQVRIRAH